MTALRWMTPALRRATDLLQNDVIKRLTAPADVPVAVNPPPSDLVLQASGFRPGIVRQGSKGDSADEPEDR
jgi:hypothetical protein